MQSVGNYANLFLKLSSELHVTNLGGSEFQVEDPEKTNTDLS